MKVTVQNGSNNLLSRKELEKIITLLPGSWGNRVNSIVLYQGKSYIESVYYEKERMLGLFSPSLTAPELTKESMVEELLVSLCCIKDGENIPNHISKSKRAYYLEKVSELKELCISTIT